MKVFSRAFLFVIASAMIVGGLVSIILKKENSSVLSFASIYSLVLTIVVLAYGLRERIKNKTTLATLWLSAILAVVAPTIIYEGMINPKFQEDIEILSNYSTIMALGISFFAILWDGSKKKA